MSKAAAAEAARAQPPARVIVSIPGMHCASCVAKIEKALTGLNGVSVAEIHLPSRTALVEFSTARLRAEEIKRAVEVLGYEVLGISDTYAHAEQLARDSDEHESWKLFRRLAAGFGFWMFLALQEWLGFSVYTAILFATAVQLWCGEHFHRGFWKSVRTGSANMNTLVSISTWAAYIFSLWVVFFPEAVPTKSRADLLESLAGLIVLVTFGRWLEIRFRMKTSEAVRKLLKLTPKTVRVIRHKEEMILPLSEVKVGESIIVRPGEQIGLDGVVEEGGSTVDESLLTGESLPVEKSAGAKVYGGTMNKNGSLVIRVSQPGEDMVLAKIIEAVRTAAASKAPVQKMVDKVAAIFVPVVFACAVTASVLWYLEGPEPRVLHAVTVLVSVLAVACPCSLGLATPLAILLGTWRSAELGIYLRNAEVLEKVGRIDAVVFDKTGTLTEGRPSVVRLLPSLKTTEKELLQLAMTADQRSEHPYAAALRQRARAEHVQAGPVESFEAFPGRGVSVVSDGEKIRVGSLSWLVSEGILIDERIAVELREVAGSILGVSKGDRFKGAIVVADRLRPSAKRAVARLKAMGMELILASGDRNKAVFQIAEEVGIGRVYAEVLPTEKSRIVKELQDLGKKVAMVGEGFNDAPALSQADIGIALAGGTDIAVESSDITLMNPDLDRLVTAVDLSRRIRRAIRENLLWAFIYNVLLIPIAAGALFPAYGVMLRPHYAGAAMALSSISVILNSMKLWRYRPS